MPEKCDRDASLKGRDRIFHIQQFSIPNEYLKQIIDAIVYIEVYLMGLKTAI
ncbi:hypothetical protein [Limnofasciculus baicalensis]|uniref:Uncharacterized protein n=1 Tax=Limnofasciculus baicalensis BBK-W-15 TaxID=2699891 RepID=A0AAE3H0Q7_9CYAN|nr:hypothetical protein [Limnofasciculus baicalensis]MCP2732142.1 hypothetical protein [Limnofasciculus baicalensis BBK-W-15]